MIDDYTDEQLATGRIAWLSTVHPDGSPHTVPVRYVHDGSGFWIAREGLKAVLRAEEESPGEGWSTPLGAHLAEVLGGTDWNQVRSFVYGGDRGKIGSLARAVGEAAKARDRIALRILLEAGEELARLANCLIKRVGPRPVALVGGSSRLHPIVAHAFRRDLVSPVEFITADLDAALTAARLAATLHKG